MSDLERKVWALSEAKASDDGHGSFSGYGSLFGVKDLGGDVVVAGAYADTVAQFKERGFIAWGHDWANPVATIREAREDARGLFIEAEFHSDPQSQQARTRTVERLARGKFMGLSIGYLAEDVDYQPDARVLKKVRLFETSLVTVPMQPDAGVTAAKSAEPAVVVPAAPDFATLLGALEALCAEPEGIEAAQLANLLDRARALCRLLEKARRTPPPADLVALHARFRTLESRHPPSARSGPFAVGGH